MLPHTTKDKLWAFIQWAAILADTPANRDLVYAAYHSWPSLPEPTENTKEAI